jgi:hypothetical protein
MNLHADVTIGANPPPLTAPLAAHFGGEPGWLSRLPGEAAFDFERGVVTTRDRRLVRSPATGKWAVAS